MVAFHVDIKMIVPKDGELYLLSINHIYAKRSKPSLLIVSTVLTVNSDSA